MTVTIGTTHGKTVRATFIPFEAMTPRQQAEHMVHAHGMGVDYYTDLPLRDEEHAVEAWLTGEFRDAENGWPEPRDIVAIHAGDQEYAEVEDILACKHTHEKGLTLPDHLCDDECGDDTHPRDAFETPDGKPVDDLHHLVAADTRDAFLHPDPDDQ